MTSERQTAVLMAKILNQTDRHDEMARYMDRIIELNPNLNSDEKALLIVAYKQLITPIRAGIRDLRNAEDTSEYKKSSNFCKEQIDKLSEDLSNELIGICQRLIDIADEKLLPAATDAESKVYYIKMKADYYRYIAEAQVGRKRDETAGKATKCYEAALSISRPELPQYTPTALGLILNYTVFLYEIVGRKQEAIQLAKQTYNDIEKLISLNDEKSYNEAYTIVTLLKDNTTLWESNISK